MVKDEKTREFLKDVNLDINKLYEEIQKVAEVAKNTVTGSTSVGGNPGNFIGKLNYEYRGNDTIITGNTYPVKELIKKAAGRWDPGSNAWKIAGKHITDKDIFG